DLQRQAVAAIALHESDPREHVAVEPLVREQILSFGCIEPMQLEAVYSTSQRRELRWGLTTGQQQAALVWAFANGLQQSTVALHACSIAPLALAGLEKRLRIVEHKQTSPGSKQLQ